METATDWLAILKFLPKPLFYGIGTGILLAVFALVALPPLERVEDVHPAR